MRNNYKSKITKLLVLTIFCFTLPPIHNTFALNYKSNIGIGFTFNPTLSVSLSSNDLIIPNLVPGSSSNSNSINVSVATNAAYGYTLSVNANSDYLTHSNNINTFNSITIDADLANLTIDNTWGYSTSLDNGSTWSNYNGLSSSSSTVLLDNSNTADSTDDIDFKIGARAGNTQASGIYTGTINFYTVTKPTPITLAEAYASEGKTMINGYYTMQDMTSTICDKTEAIGAQLQVLDKRDNKLYWISKLADNHCWMTQNLDLDLDSNRTYTHWDTDLGWSTENGNSVDESATWEPMRSTLNFTIGTAISGWQDSNTEPYSANPGDVYFYTSNTDANDIQYNSLQECTATGHNDCTHYHAGNYYNWSAAVASNDTSGMINKYDEAPKSICPSKWELPKMSLPSENFKKITNIYKISTNTSLNLRNQPLYYVRPGIIDSLLAASGRDGGYRINAIYNDINAYYLLFSIGYFNANLGNSRHRGVSVRCLAR